MNNVVHIGSVTLGSVPRIAAIIDRRIDADQVQELSRRGAQLVEVRIDCLDIDINEIPEYVAQVKQLSGLGVIGTIRENDRTKGKRIDLFEQVMPHVDAIDIEIDCDIRDTVTALAQGKTIIISDHDYNGTPDTPRLQDLADQAIEAGASIVKLAAMANSASDSVRLMQFCRHCPHPLVVIGMGEHGTITRLAAPLFGSLFTFAFLHDSVAPGQVRLDQMVADMRRYYPLFYHDNNA